MPNRPQRMCSKCHGTAVPGTRFCLIHQNAVAVADRQRKQANPAPYNPNCKAWRQTAVKRCCGIHSAHSSMNKGTDAHALRPKHITLLRQPNTSRKVVTTWTKTT